MNLVAYCTFDMSLILNDYNLISPKTQRTVRHHRHHRRGASSNWKKVLNENTSEFCKNSTLHGLKYVVDKQLYPFERIFFAISFVVVVILSIFLISNVYTKWQTTPVILSLNPVQTVISQVPFPAVTICNLNQAVKSKVQSFRKDTIEYAMLQTICHREVNMTVVNTMHDWNMLERFIVNISQPCTKLLLTCRYGGVDYNCSDIFRPIVTDAGLCCVFNMVHPQFMYIPEIYNIMNISYSDGTVPVDWDPEHGYPAKLPPKYYPRTAAGTGENLGLTIIANIDSKEYYCSSSNGMGFKISLHSPTETPHIKEVGLFVAAGTETKMRITAVKSEADLKLRSMDKKYRQCLFDSEAALEYFSYYTKRNCEMECLTRMVMKQCGCFSHYMPKIFKNGSICGINDMPCVEKYRRISMLSDDNKHDCHDLCWPSCFDLTFVPDFFTIPLSHDGFSIENQFVQNMSSIDVAQNIAILHLYFKENTYRSHKQTEFIGVTDFLSGTGGLIGLFMGFSFISLAEIVYYAFVRPFTNMRRNRSFIIISSNSNTTLAARVLENKSNDNFERLERKPNINHIQALELTDGLGYYGLDINNWQKRKSHGFIAPKNK